jgi:hypothetical protein
MLLSFPFRRSAPGKGRAIIAEERRLANCEIPLSRDGQVRPPLRIMDLLKARAGRSTATGDALIAAHAVVKRWGDRHDGGEGRR